MSGLYSDFFNARSGVQTEESITHSLPGANTKVAKMKKLNIFSGANKKQSYSRANSSPVSPPGIHTLVSKKEEVYFNSCLNDKSSKLEQEKFFIFYLLNLPFLLFLTGEIEMAERAGRI